VTESSPYQAVVIGGSAGGREALVEILASLPANFPVAIAVVIHLHPHSDAGDSAISLERNCRLPVNEAGEKQLMRPGHVYLAPANYHLLIELDGRFALNIDPKVNYSRPSIDVLFQSAADAFKDRLIGVLLSGASSDGAYGLARIRESGGYTLVQEPASACYPVMPSSAIEMGGIDQILPSTEIGQALITLTNMANR